MTLSVHLDPDVLESRLLKEQSPRKNIVGKYILAKKKFHEGSEDDEQESKFVARFRGIQDKYRLPENGMDPVQVYEMLHDDLTLDGSTTLNLASFVNTHVDENAHKLLMENLTKNLADNDEYPMLLDLQQRCVSMLADMWHADGHNAEIGGSAVGTACTGSSEAIMLGGLAMKKNWQAQRKAKGLDIQQPNILMASCCQVALEKFARYFDVEARIVPVSPDNFLIDYDKIQENLDENTIGVFVILGSTFTGGFENVIKVNEVLQDYQDKTGLDIPIHVDGASGALIASVVYPDLVWDFRLPRVKSINCSGHKFGFATAGLGWIIFRNQAWLPQELKFQLQYLGGLEESFNLNFSRPGFQVVHQYFNFLHLGHKGFHQIFDNCLTNARLLANFLEETGIFTCVSDLHLPFGTTARDSGAVASRKGSGLRFGIASHTEFNPALPVVSFQFSPDFAKKYPELPQSMVSKLLRSRKWIIPNYSLPRTSEPPAEDTNKEILRIVAKYNLTSQLLDKLMHDIVEVVDVLTTSIELVRQHAESSEEAVGSEMVYNMLLSVANDGNQKLMRLKDGREMKAHEDHVKHDHVSFRGTC